jgi:hypothetical protein
VNLAATIEIYGGGPGSGCNPEAGKCGRHGESSGPYTTKKEAFAERDRRRASGEEVKVYQRSGAYTQPHGKGRGVESFVEYYVAPPGYAERLK